jgi:hypothetical protein
VGVCGLTLAWTYCSTSSFYAGIVPCALFDPTPTVLFVLTGRGPT